MNNGDQYDSRLWKVLEKERLADLSQFHQLEFFDEVPLFSRDADIAFLKRDAPDAANRILLGFALRFLKSVIAYQEHSKRYFAAITVWNIADHDILVPNLFVWYDAVPKLTGQLFLHSVTTSFGKSIRRFVSGLDRAGVLEVLEDTATDPETARAFVGLSQAPYRAFLPLGGFATAATVSRGKGR